MRDFRSYVALGDSFTAGNGVLEGHRWADLVAAELSADRDDFSYLNLAVDGADSEIVLGTIDDAIDFGPELITLVCGANDVLLTTRPDVSRFAVRFDRMLSELRGDLPGSFLLVSTYPSGWWLPGVGPRTRARIDSGIREINRSILDISAAHSVPCMDVAAHPGAQDPGNIDGDGLHPSEVGHRQAAREFIDAIRRHSQLDSQPRRINA